MRGGGSGYVRGLDIGPLLTLFLPLRPLLRLMGAAGRSMAAFKCITRGGEGKRNIWVLFILVRYRHVAFGMAACYEDPYGCCFLAAHEFVEHDAGGDGDVDGVGAGGHGEGGGAVAEGAEGRGEAAAFFAEDEGERGWGGGRGGGGPEGSGFRAKAHDVGRGGW